MQHNKPLSELPGGKKLDVQDVHVYHDGPMAEHDYSCPVCRKNHAVLDFSTGLMQPCWRCQEQHGYELISGKILDEIISETRKNTIIGTCCAVLALFVIFNVPSIFG